MRQIETIIYEGNKDYPNRQVFDSLSQMVSDYTNNPKTAGEMLPKTPEQLSEIHHQGLSLIYINGQNQPIAHAAAWPLFNDSQLYLQLYEFGTWIVNKDLRHHRINGLTIGESVAQDLIRRLTNKNDANGHLTSFITTVKRENSLKGLLKVGFQTISFHQFPFITGLTCSCPTSEHFNSTSCQHRRKPNFGETLIQKSQGNIYQFEELILLNGEDARKIPCTLLGCGNFGQTELKLNQLFRELRQHDLPQLDTIDVETIKTIGNFYNQLGINI